MEQLERSEDAFAAFVAESLRRERFFLVDVGVSGGIATTLRVLGNKLCGLGFDKDKVEIARLSAIDPSPELHYIHGVVGLADDHPYAARARISPRLTRNPWPRLAVERWLTLRDAREQGFSMPPRLLRQNAPEADSVESDREPSGVIDLARFLLDRQVGFIDLLKIDVDGADFEILQSMDGRYDEFRVLGIGIEVNFFGSAAETANTFHNIDRFLKARE